MQEFIELPASQFSVSNITSLLQFSLHSERDYGTVQCLATNLIGRQAEPCNVQLVPRDTPERPEECRVTDLGPESVVVECVTYSDSLGQVFILELYQVRTDLRVSQCVTSHVRTPS